MTSQLGSHVGTQMGSQMAARLGVSLAAITAITVSLVAGCGSSGSRDAKIELLAPDDGAELTIEDDRDLETPGLQYDVGARSENIRSGTVVLLQVEGERATYASTVDDQGEILFDNATLPPGAHTLTVTTAAGAASSDAHAYTFRTLVIETPRDGAGIAVGDDTDKDQDGLQINVTVKAYAIDPKQDISLSIDGEEVGDAVRPNDDGEAVFRGITLATGSHKLKAVAGDLESDETRVSVNGACANVDFVTPEMPVEGDRITLAGGDACPDEGDDYTTTVVISTDAGDGRDVDLMVNGTAVAKTTVQGSLARFNDVVLNRRSSANEISVAVQGAGGVTCPAEPFPVGVFVDCKGSDCSLGGPVPYSGRISERETALYLNRSMMTSGGFDIRVDSDTGILGQKVELIIDGRDGKSALSADPKPNGNKVSATFAKVKLDAGEHEIEARCTDSQGNVNESGKVKWIVDVDPCAVHIDDPAPDILFLSGDDADSDTANGVQADVKATIDGDDCIQTRAGVCDGESVEGNFEDFEGSSFDQRITLETSPEQTLCVEVKDRADNRAQDSVGIRYRSTEPKLKIESPRTGLSVNAAGDADHTADSDPATPVCNTDFSVLCTELGAPVSLRHGNAMNAPFATGTCQARASGDPDLPDDYVGRAKLDDVAFLPSAAASATIVATQTVNGDSNTLLVGKSDEILLTGWCEPPPISLVPACPAEQLELPAGGGAYQLSFLQATYDGATLSAAPATGKLTVTGATSGELYSQTAPRMSNRYQFSNVSLGNVTQSVETVFTATDMFGNETTLTCESNLVSDLPEVTISSPVNGASFGPGSGCAASAAGKFGVPVSLTLDTVAMRELRYAVNAGTAVVVPITGTNMDVCIPVDHGTSTIELQLASTLTTGVAKPSISVDVDTLRLTAPLNNATLLAADDYCDPGFGARVQASADPIHAGSAVTISAGSTTVNTAAASNGAIDACITLPPGSSTLTVSLDGKSISDTANVSVVAESPTNPIALTGVTLPAAGSYRSGEVGLQWATPTENYLGQLKDYELRCASESILASATPTQKNAWWDAAVDVPLPSGVLPPANSVTVDLQIGGAGYCVIRGRDAATQLTPIPDGFAVDYPFRQQAVDVSALNRMGTSFAEVGDVNGDGINDVLIGGTGQAYLYFGSATGLAGKASPDVTLLGSAGLAGYEFGSRTVGLGDINGDGRNDFAIGHPSYSPTAPIAITRPGAVFVFYGRASGDAWPSTVDVASTSSCGADVCFVAELTNELLGFSLAPAGDFNGDSQPDLATGAIIRPLAGAPSPDTTAGRLYVILGRAFEGAGGTRPAAFWNLRINFPSGEPVGFYVDGAGATGSDATSSSQMGTAVVAVGNIDGLPGDDLVVSALGKASPAITSKLYFLSGRVHDGLAPQLKAIPTSALSLRDSGTANEFAVRLTSFRNWYDGAQMGIPDVGVFSTIGDSFYVYLGDNDSTLGRFANGTRIQVNGLAGTRLGNAGLGTSHSFNPNLDPDSLGDLDADGLDDACFGSLSAVGGTTAAPLSLFYGSAVDAGVAGRAIGYGAAYQLELTARTGASVRTCEYVGDITGDGEPDLVIGEPNANSNAGGFTVLY